MPKSARKSEGVEPSSSSDCAPAYVSIQRNVFCLGDKGKETVWGPAHAPPVGSALPSGQPL